MPLPAVFVSGKLHIYLIVRSGNKDASSPGALC